MSTVPPSSVSSSTSTDTHLSTHHLTTAFTTPASHSACQTPILSSRTRQQMNPRPMLLPVQVGPSLMVDYPFRPSLHNMASRHSTPSQHIRLSVRDGETVAQPARGVHFNPIVSHYRSPMMSIPSNAPQYPAGLQPAVPPRPQLRSQPHQYLEPSGYQGYVQEGFSMLPGQNTTGSQLCPSQLSAHVQSGSSGFPRTAQFVGGTIHPTQLHSQPVPAQQQTPATFRPVPKTLPRTQLPQSQAPFRSSTLLFVLLQARQDKRQRRRP